LRWVLNAQSLITVTNGPFFFMENQVGVEAKIRLNHQYHLLFKTGHGIAFIQNEYYYRNDLSSFLNGKASFLFSTGLSYTFSKKSKSVLNPKKIE
jgi:hypothetical protein